MNYCSLQGKRILITGATGNLGYEVALGLSESDATVLATKRPDSIKYNEIQGLTEAGCELLDLDLNDRESIDWLIGFLQDEPLHGFVNNAMVPVSGQSGLEDVALDRWRQGMDGALNMPFYLMQQLIPLMKGHGSIVNIASMYGTVSPCPQVYNVRPQSNNPPHYGAAKAALIQLTRYVACYLAEDGVRVNAVSPGAFPQKGVLEDQAFIDELCSRIPMGKIGQPQELIGPIAFLLSDASSYVTGQNLIVDGGWTSW